VLLQADDGKLLVSAHKAVEYGATSVMVSFKKKKFAASYFSDPPFQISALEVTGRGSVACFVGETCSVIVAPSAFSSAQAASFDGLTFEARLIGPAIVNLHVQPASNGSYTM
jgi:hypothetical protein